MNFEYFFWQELRFIKEGVVSGFELYSWGHLVWLASIVIATVAVSIYFKKQSGEMRDKIRKFFAWTIVFFEISKDAMLAITGVSLMGYLPFHLCSLAIFGMLLHVYGGGKMKERMGQMFAYLFFPGAMAALLFCNWTCYPFFNFMNIHSFSFHGWLVCYLGMNYWAGDIRPTYKGLWRSLEILAFCAPPIYLFDKLTDTNYMFLNEASEGSPLIFLWDIFGTRFGEIGYLASYAVLAIAVLHVFYILYWILERCLGQKEQRRNSSSGMKLHF